MPYHVNLIWLQLIHMSGLNLLKVLLSWMWMLLLHLQPHGLLWLLGMEKVSCCSGGLKVFPCVILYLVRLSEAVLWALQLALSEQFLYVIIEGDSQICMDSLNGNSSYGSWSISSICNDILALCKSFSGCNFC